VHFSLKRLHVVAGLLVLSACGGGGGGSNPTPPPVANAAPTVNAGLDATIRLPVDNVALDGTVSDDGLPAGAAVSTAWSVQSGPAGANFADVNAVDTTVTFVTEGTYVLELTANDTALTGSDTVTVIVEAAPAVASIAVTPSDAALLTGGMQMFSAAGTDQYGDAIAVNISWTASGGTIDAAGNYTAGGTMGTFTVTASDGSVSGTANVTISASPPTANAGGPYTGVEGAAVAVDGSGSTDANNDIVSYEWDFNNDGVYDDATGVNASFAAAGSGVFPIGLRVTDGDGATDSDTTTVTLTNLAPTANAQAASTDEDTALAITLTGSDPGSDPLTFAIGTGPANGTLSGTAPNVTYTPNPDFNGADSFTFTVNDGALDSASATVSITVNPVNDAPTADAQVVSTDEDVPLPITLTGTDPESDPLTFAIGTGPANGVLSGTAPDVTYTPNANYNGADSFTFTVNDGALPSAEATVSITVNSGIPLPTVTLTASPTAVVSGFSSTLTWSSTNASSCDSSWSGPKTTAGSEAATPTVDTTYTLTCTNSTGSASDSATVTITDPPVGGPVAYWPLDEGGGVAAVDGSGNGNTGALTNGPVWAVGQIEGAVEFDGVDDYLEVADSDSLDIASDLTISAWIYPRTLGANDQGRIVDKASQDGTVGYVFRMNSASRIGMQQSGIVGGIDSSDNAIILNAWNHVVGVVQSGIDVTLYANGMVVGTGSLTSAIAANTKSLRIGIRHDGGQAFNGIIDEVRIYDQALTAAEVDALYQTGTNKFSIDDRVQTTLDLNVRATPSSTGTLAGVQPTGSLGTVISGPITADGFTWWKLDYDNVPDGWSIEDWLEKPPSSAYYPAPESAGGWRSLAPLNSTPTAAQKTDIINIAGIDWDLLEAAHDYSETLATGTTVLVIRNGWIAGEWGATSNYNVASVTKSLTGLAAAKMMDLSDGGKLSQSIGFESLAHQYLPPAFGDSDPLKMQIKIKHLMTMSPGIQPADPDLLTMNERLTYPMDAAPETEWVYSSLPPNLLSMIIQNVTGQSFGDFFNARIASAVGALPLAWESIDGGFTKGAAGATGNARDLARIAYLSLQDGVWDNGTGLKQIVSAAQISTTTQWAPHLENTTFRVSPGSPFPVPADSPNHYGHLWWTNRTQVALGSPSPVDTYYMHGFRDNLVVIVPSKNMIVIRLSSGGPGTDTTFRSQFMSLVMSSLLN